MASFVLGTGGAVLGLSLGGPVGAAIGAGIGAAIGGYIDNTILFPPANRTVTGPRITDPAVQRSQWGLPVNRLFGAARVTCPIIWANPIRQAIYQYTDGGGKGAPKTTFNNYAYYADFAVLIGEGPISTIKSIWLNGQQWLQGSQVTGTGVVNTVAAVGTVGWANVIQGGQRVGYSANFNNTTVTVYTGTSFQQPDPIIEAAEGASRTPAYRGRAYIVFHNLALNVSYTGLPNFGGSVPVVECEFITEGEIGYGSAFGTVPLHAVLWPLCQKAGLAPPDVDMTQMTTQIQGGAHTNVEPARTSIQRIAAAYLFDMCEVDGQIKFVQQPAPTQRLEYQQRVLIGETGLIVNSYQDDLGRGGYFSGDSGTSEGQLLMINGCCRAYQVTGNISWLNRAIFMASALEPTLYMGQTVPTSPSPSQSWAPHWLFAAREPIQLQDYRLYYRLQFANNGDGTMTGVMPPGPGSYGDLVKTVFQVFPGDGSAWLQWDNPYSPVIGGDFSPSIISVTTSVNSDGTPQVNTGTTTIVAEAPTDGSSPICNITYTYQCGPMIGVGEAYEAWPCWRLLQPGEIDCAPDSLYWALDCFDRLRQVDTANSTKWSNAFASTGYAITNTFAVDDGRNWIRPMLGGSAFSDGGAYDASVRAGMSDDNWTRDPVTGYVIGLIPEDSDPVVIDYQGNPLNWLYNTSTKQDYSYNPIPPGHEAQYGQGLTDSIQTGDTEIRVEMTAFVGVGGGGAFSGGGVTTEIAVWISTQSAYSEATRYFCYLDGKDGRPGPIINQLALQVFDIPISAFKNNNGRGTSLTNGATVAVIGISDFEPVAHQLTIASFRPMPVQTLPYQPNVAPFTVNMLYGDVVDWRGAPGTGYQHAYLWRFLGKNQAGGPLDPSNSNSQLAFLAASQAAYTAQSPGGAIVGPFHAAYVWNRYDAAQDGTPNTWTWDWPDPNTMWGGYQYRPLAALARTACPASVLRDGAPSGVAGNPGAAALVTTYLNWLDGYWHSATPQGAPPTNFRPAEAPTFEYDEPHMAALIMRAAIYGHLASTAGVSGAPTTATCESLIEKAYDYLVRLYVASGPMGGTWCTDLLTGDVEPAAGWTWYGFWHGEIIETLATFQYEGSSIISTMIANGKLPSNCIAVMSGWLAGSDSWLTANTRTITYVTQDDLGAQDATNATSPDAAAIWQQTRTQDPDLPNEVQVWFSDPVEFYQQNYRYARRLSKSNVQVERIDTNLALDPPDAQDIATRNLYVMWLRRNPIEWQMSRAYMAYAPGDVMELPLRGQNLPIYIQRVDYSAPGILKFTGVDHDPSLFRYSALGQTQNPTVSLGGAIADPGAMTMVYGDWPKLTDVDPDFALYLAGSGGSAWTSGSIYRSDDGGQTYIDDADFPVASTVGVAFTALGSGPWWALDRGATVNIYLTRGTLSSVSEGQVTGGTANAAMLGSELIQFVNATLQSDGSWLLDTLYRGRRGTEWAIPSHAAGETFVLLDPSLVYDQMTAGDIGVTRLFKPVTAGEDITTVAALSETYSALCMKLWAPTFIRGNRDASGDLTITWERRSREGDTWLETGDPPLAETAESYVIQMWNDAATAVVATYNISNASFAASGLPGSFAYSAAQQTADFGIVKWGLNVAICQVSGYVGNGTFSPIVGI